MLHDGWDTKVVTSHAHNLQKIIPTMVKYTHDTLQSSIHSTSPTSMACALHDFTMNSTTLFSHSQDFKNLIKTKDDSCLQSTFPFYSTCFTFCPLAHAC